MTKTVRIENADLAEYEVVVEVWERNGADLRLSETIVLTHAASLQQFTIWDGRYLKVYERPKAKS